MDHFGIGAAIRAMVGVYLTTARQSGRTTSLVESLKNGDRVVCLNSLQAQRLRGLCLERGVKIETMIVDPCQPGAVFGRPPAEGRTIFDHTWVEAFYTQAIEAAAREIDHLERETSGSGAAHRTTRRKAQELGRWAAFQPSPFEDRWGNPSTKIDIKSGKESHGTPDSA